MTTQTTTQVSKKLEIVIYENWDLDQLEGEFEVAAFERDVKQSHVEELKEAILAGRLYDPILTVMSRKTDDVPFELIDGQYRFTALKELRDEGKLSKYTFGVKILHGEDARLAYRMLNSGKPLTLDDILKSYDDGSVQCFNKLKEFCVFYGSHPNKLPFSLAIKGQLHGSLKGGHGGAQRERIIKQAQRLKGEELELLKALLNLIRTAQAGMIEMRSVIMKVPIFYTICRIFANNYDIGNEAKSNQKFIRFIKAVAGNKQVAELARQGRSVIVLQQAEELLKSIWNSC